MRKGDQLSPTELRVITLVAEGLSTEGIGKRLDPPVALETVKMHLRHIYMKLGTHSRAHAIAICYQEGFLAVEPPPVEDPATPREAGDNNQHVVVRDWMPRLYGKPFTEIELAILTGVSYGLTSATISERMYLSEATIQTHITRILTKLGARDRAHAVRRALEKGHLKLDDPNPDDAIVHPGQPKRRQS